MTSPFFSESDISLPTSSLPIFPLPVLVVASHNTGKLGEFQTYLQPLATEVLAMPQDLDIPETESTFLGNAALKAKTVALATQQWAIADDSGLEVRALAGAPGLYSARYGSTDQERIERLLRELAGQGDRSARFVCVLALANPAGEIVAHCEGECLGEILEAPRGTAGFGYDPIFFVPSMGLSFAEMEPEMKQQVSHRGQALQHFLAQMNP
ncbi:RdgB/HAM1 family non-canonical purine NTP pyrophosphatase [Candidatus Synechococcus calcipolaris G9]|uniref:dITP/XTP pyrophosphatase n=1 Tax=Candidatus Synechococcus calcipolaris G9 TaxID=1497997 RepID=A0ABT6EVZ1_9SYNE|nr:RdgB/HAM1 family non-canonical purine NTP pyrophosphatase [Candidatus Synechococcus calcipolaris]MDG2989956.1 RdgB/HAM1 family non-canonical purine NTP pyrophosphatase [Candidatus Synechococcus calcipolaris G9]